MAAYTRGCILADCTVGSTMSPEVESCAPGTSLALAEERMRMRQVRRLPVVDDGRLVGIVSLNDLALAAANRKTAKDAAISPHEVATTLARISEHRAQPSA
jgi:CBS domain-containing protein